MSFCNQGPRTPRNSRQECRTPRRERRSAAPQVQQQPIENVLQDASHFPCLSKSLLATAVRGRKQRSRSFSALDDNGMPTRSQSNPRERPTREREQPSQQDSSEAEEPQPTSRARAYSCDAGVDAIVEAAAAAPRTPRGGLKKPRDSGASIVDDEEVIKMEKEMQELLAKLVAKRGGCTVGMQLNQMLAAALPQESETAADVMPNEPEAKSTSKPCVDDKAEEVEVVRPRRLSNPRSNALELPTGLSWEYPLTKNEKKARVVMISDIEKDILEDECVALQEKSVALQEENSRLSMSPKKSRVRLSFEADNE